MLLSRGFVSSVIFCIHLFLPTHCMQMLESFFFCLFLVVLCLRHYWCLFVDPLCICVFCVSLKCFCSCCGLCLFMVFAISCGAFFSLWCRSQDETWGLPGFLLRVLRLPTTAVCLVWMQSGWSISGNKTKRCVKKCFEWSVRAEKHLMRLYVMYSVCVSQKR